MRTLLTIGGCLAGLGAAAAISFGHFTVALILIAANRVADGLDGAVAATTRRTDRGAFLDIVLDFVVYTAVPLGFAIWDAQHNALAAAFLLASYLANGSAFLAFSAMTAKRGLETAEQGQKSIYYLGEFYAEGFWTIAFMVAVCLFPAAFATARDHLCVLLLRVGRRARHLGWRLLP